MRRGGAAARQRNRDGEGEGDGAAKVAVRKLFSLSWRVVRQNRDDEVRRGKALGGGKTRRFSERRRRRSSTREGEEKSRGWMSE